MSRARVRRALASFAFIALLPAAAGCSEQLADDAPSKPTSLDAGSSRPQHDARPRPRPSGCTTSTRRLQSRRIAYAGIVKAHTAVFRRPGRGEIVRLAPRNLNGVPTVVAIVAVRRDAGCRAGWYRVQLPLRPNGSSGWVRASKLDVRPVRTRILVELSRRRVTLYRDGGVVLVTTAAVGHPSTPTPTGRFYVNQRLRAADPSGAFGPGAIGISAFSPTLRSWPQGGPIAIHGTNRPGEIGFAVSHGCVRVRNDDLERLYALAREGTPVEIRV